MSALGDEISGSFETLYEVAGVTVRFADTDYRAIQMESNEVAELALGGIDEELEGAFVILKADFTSGLPDLNTKFFFDNMLGRVADIRTDQTDPTMTIGFSKIQDLSTPPAVMDAIATCYDLDGGNADPSCN